MIKEHYIPTIRFIWIYPGGMALVNTNENEDFIHGRVLQDNGDAKDIHPEETALIKKVIFQGECCVGASWEVS